MWAKCSSASTSPGSRPPAPVAIEVAALLMPPEDMTFRIAAVDYDGKSTLAAYKANPPKTPDEEQAFVAEHAPRLLSGVVILQGWIASL